MGAPEPVYNVDAHPLRRPPHIERFMRSIKKECLERMIFFGEGAPRNAIREFLDHCHRERNHQGLRNQLIDASEQINRMDGGVRCRQKLGGMLRYYYRDAA